MSNDIAPRRAAFRLFRAAVERACDIFDATNGAPAHRAACDESCARAADDYKAIVAALA